MISYDITRPCRNPRFRSWSPQFKIDNSRNIVADNKRQAILYRKREHSLRKVPAFTIQSEQKCTRPFTPANAVRVRESLSQNENAFTKFYEDQRFPVRIITTGLKPTIEWLVDPSTLPVNQAKEALTRFSSGLPLEKAPFSQVAFKSFMDMLTIPTAPQMVAESLTQIIPNIRKGLDSKKFEKRVEMLRVIRAITTLTGIGPLLVPFYRTILTALRTKMSSKVDLDITTRQKDKFLDEMTSTLRCLEKTGGRHAYLNIKYVIPDYQKSVFY